MRFKRLLSLLLAAALALSLLAGCGGGKALSQVIVDLLDNLYSNVSVEADSDLTAALKQAAAEGGTEEEILSRMIEILNHKGGSITFTRLGSGQQGEHGVTLYFQPGTDPDAAARNALAQWAGTLGTLPDDGSYQGDVAMIETENGYYIALDVEVLKAGKPDKPDKDDDEPETKPEQDKGYSYDTESGTYTVKEADGLQELFNDKNDSDFDGITITLEASVPYTVNTDDGPLAETFKGELQGNGATVTITDGTQGLFNTNDGTVQDVDIQVSGTISGNGNIGAVAGTNNGTIQNCDVTGSTIQGDNYNDNVGGIVGDNYGTIQGCSAAVTVKDGKLTGGIAGSNSDGGSITDCRSTGTVTSGSGYSYTGGVVGYNESATITACYSTGAITSSNSNSYTGGVAGNNVYKSGSGGQIIACYSTGTVSGTTAGGVVGWNSSYSAVTACYHAGTVQGSSLPGGVVGSNTGSGTVTACYWGSNPDTGIGYNEGGSTTIETTKVEGNVTWQNAVDAMNNALKGKGWQYELTDGLPTLKKTNP